MECLLNFGCTDSVCWKLEVLKIVREFNLFVIYFKIDRTYFEKENYYLMAKKKNRRRRRSFSEKVIIVLGILIAVSMVLSTVASVLGPTF